jgi:hypothetical protein
MAGMNNGSNEQIDPRVAELLENLRETSARQPAAEERTRARFLAELDALPSTKPLPVSKPKEGFTMFSPTKRFIFSAVIFVAVAFLFVFGGSALTVLASQNALPGDRLYAIKTSVEQTRTSLSRDAGDRAELYIDFAGRRLMEIEQLIAEGRFNNVGSTTLEFEMHIQNALLEIDAVSARDPERAAILLQQITQTLLRYSNALSIMMDDVPDSVRSEMMRALRAARSAGGIDNENMNSNENLNENLNANENANLNENLNENENANLNENRNTNENTNESLTATPRPTQRWIDNDDDDDDDNDNDDDDDDDDDNGDDDDNDNDD